MKNRIYVTITLVVIFSGFAPIPQTVNSQTGVDIKIGFLTPLTGSLSELGPTFMQGGELAIAELNAMQSDYNFVLRVQDTKTDVSSADVVAIGLVDQGVSGVVGAAASSITLGAMPTLRDAKIPQISYASTSPALTNADDNDFLFRVSMSDELQGNVAAYLTEKLNVKSMAIIGIDDLYGQSIMNSFENTFQSLGGTITKVITYDQISTVDFTSLIAELIRNDPEGVFMVSYITDGAIILNELYSQSFGGTIIGTASIGTENIFDQGNLHINATQGVQGIVPTISGNAEFISTFKEAYGSDPGIFVAEAFDATMILGKAVLAANSGIGSDVRDAIRGVALGYDGASGLIQFDENGDRKSGAFDIWQFNNGELSVIGSWVDNTISGTFTTRSVTFVSKDLSSISTYPVDSNTTISPPYLQLPINFYTFIFTPLLIAILSKIRRKKSVS